MGNKDWDNYLRDLLGDFKTEGETPHWDEFAEQLDPTNSQSAENDLLQDQILKEKLNIYRPADKVSGWERIEDSLNATDKAFDEEVRHRVKQYQASSNPESWAVFMKHFSAHKILRAKLIALKVTETAALILILFTFFQLGKVGRLPFISPASEPIAGLEQEIQSSKVESNISQASEDKSSEKASSSVFGPSHFVAETVATKAKPSKSIIREASAALSHLDSSLSGVDEVILYAEPTELNIQSAIHVSTAPLLPMQAEEAYLYHSDLQAIPAAGLEESSSLESGLVEPRQADIVTSCIMPRSFKLKNANFQKVPDPVYVHLAEQTYLEFGMLAQADYNQLKMPEDKLYNDGKQFVFPLEGIISSGYGAGFTLAIGHSRWAFETGLIYSAKTFKPGRELTIGSIFDNSNVDFEAMRMQVVSIPFQYRYRFDHKGRLKVYAIAGFGFHYIAQSDVDVLVEHNFNSLKEGQDPNTVPSLARTIRQAKQVSDDLKDSAPFSTKSFISANLGAGIEYAVAERKTLFLQSTYQYQIPNLSFSNYNGKHLLTVSLQAGVRTPLGS